jgi:N-succinyldiaminopimelate aminotransferase
MHGATEAICAALTALCDVGDEVIVFEPFYDSYRDVYRDGGRGA